MFTIGLNLKKSGEISPDEAFRQIRNRKANRTRKGSFNGKKREKFEKL